MKDLIRSSKKTLFGVTLGLFLTTPAVADDIEIYTVANLTAPTIQPNVMFIMDSSTSMLATLPASDPYDYNTTYDLAGGYDPTKVYYSDDGSIPVTNGSFFDWDANKCDHSLKEYAAGATVWRDGSGNVVAEGTTGATSLGSLYTTGIYAGQIAQFYAQSSKRIWRSLSTNNATTQAYPIECKQDDGIHGGDTNPSTVFYIANKPDTTSGWTSTAGDSVAATIWANSANNYTLFAGNYLNYLVDPAVSTSSISLFDQLKNAIEIIVASASNINIGLSRYDSQIKYIGGVDYGGEGGAIRYPALDVNLGRQNFYSALKTMNAGGDPVPAQTYFEVLQYFGGKAIVYGNAANPSNATGVKENGNPNYYDTPIKDTCQKNYIITVTNGLSRYDYVTASDKAYMSGFVAGSCDSDPYVPGITNNDAFDSEGSTIDNCLDEMAEWAFNPDNDVAERAFPAHEGNQHITTYTVGFAFPAAASQELKDGEQLLRDAGRRGGGRFLQADDQDDLVMVLTELLAEILKVNSTFSSPAVSVNAFNRSTNLDDLYFTLFKPAQGEHWEGNFKKFKLLFDATTGDPFVADQLNKPAIDANTGFFKDTSSSYWTLATESPDGPETAKGGAASHFDIPPARKIYTMLSSYSGSNGVLTPGSGTIITSTNKLAKSNAGITEAMLNITGFTPIIGTTPYRDSLLDWASGIDVLDSDVDGSTTDARRMMGDPLHAEPGLVQYGLSGGQPDLVSYVATNDGYLHAINTLDGSENFAFVPREMLGSLDNIFVDSGVNGKQYGLDGNVVAWINDANNDGTISGSSEHVYLYFGMRRGGDMIYSLDVTTRTAPSLRWIIDGGVGDFAELGQTWSAPNVEKLKMGSSAKRVLVFGGGYDTNQDVATTRTQDSIGRGVFIVDADTGALLWRAGPDAAADLRLTDMKYSIPARVKPLDVNGDGYMDRMYVGDMGGQLWRFDIDNNSNTASTVSVTGGRIADFAVDNSVQDTRRFYYPPDVALIVAEGQAPFLSIVAASGYRAHPLDVNVHDRFYMMRDYDIYSTPSSYDTLTESDLYDTTSNLIGEGTSAQITSELASLNSAEGWYINLNELDGSWLGEKSLAEPLILNGTAIITTYFPASAGLTSNSCTPNDGTGAIYFVKVSDGTPTFDLSGDDVKTRADRRVYLDRGGIPPTPSVIITEAGTPTLCVGTECSRAGDLGTIQKMYWYEVEQ